VSITTKTRKLLWSCAGGRCAICRIQLTEAASGDDPAAVLGEECHIAPRSPDGPRAEVRASTPDLDGYTPIGVESLTPSQRRVAELAANGMTNRQIAQTLFLTVKTIESHLAGAYDTLGIRSRQQLPAALSLQPSRGS
jgi:DNA-binding NarL/FixJ family response regulator